MLLSFIQSYYFTKDKLNNFSFSPADFNSIKYLVLFCFQSWCAFQSRVAVRSVMVIRVRLFLGHTVQGRLGTQYCSLSCCRSALLLSRVRGLWQKCFHMHSYMYMAVY